MSNVPLRRRFLTVDQGWSWGFSIAEYVVKIIFAVGHFYLHRKVQGEKQSLADNAGGATSDLLQNVF